MIYSIDFFGINRKDQPVCLCEISQRYRMDILPNKKRTISGYFNLNGEIIFIKLQSLWKRFCEITERQCIKQLV